MEIFLHAWFLSRWSLSIFDWFFLYRPIVISFLFIFPRCGAFSSFLDYSIFLRLMGCVLPEGLPSSILSDFSRRASIFSVAPVFSLRFFFQLLDFFSRFLQPAAFPSSFFFWLRLIVSFLLFADFRGRLISITAFVSACVVVCRGCIASYRFSAFWFLRQRVWWGRGVGWFQIDWGSAGIFSSCDFAFFDYFRDL